MLLWFFKAGMGTEAHRQIAMPAVSLKSSIKTVNIFTCNTVYMCNEFKYLYIFYLVGQTLLFLDEREFLNLHGVYLTPFNFSFTHF